MDFMTNPRNKKQRPPKKMTAAQRAERALMDRVAIRGEDITSKRLKAHDEFVGSEKTKRASSAIRRSFKSENEALAYLKKNHPRFFKNKESLKLASIIVLELNEELALLSPIQQAGTIACIMSLMYKMGSAAMTAIRLEGEKRNMETVFYEEYFAQAKEAEAMDGNPNPST